MSEDLKSDKTFSLKPVRGISVVNPDEVERNYLLFCIDYAIKNDYNHVQITGPIHDPVKGNIDGMTFSVKYAQFNYEKDASYVNNCMQAVNEACEKASAAGVKTYMWHHELALPTDFGKVFPEVLNENGDIEVSHPLVKDYLENKIRDFFAAYPKMDGVVLTLHETKIPLLKLKNQKLGKIERVKYVTKILYDTCKSLGKDLIVRPFASLAEDQSMMLKAYEEISPEMTIMDKWTKFDWSLTLPDNDFFKEIKVNPFVIETDIFGEYFGKGRLPIMLKNHIEKKFAYCNRYNHNGFVNRIDRNYQNPFGTVNEVNLVVMHALVNGLDVEKETDKFFNDKYGAAGKDVRRIMERTEENQKKIFYLNGYYFTQGSYFPEVNQAKNHFWFEIMKENMRLASDEWFIPVGWKRGAVGDLLKEKDEAASEAEELLKEVNLLKGKTSDEEHADLVAKFQNLYYAAHLWRELAYAIYNYEKVFETDDDVFESKLKQNLKNINELNAAGKKVLGEKFYNYKTETSFFGDEDGERFTDLLEKTFYAEKTAYEKIRNENLTDYVICGSANEGHELQKEVNFSDTVLAGGEICRIPGNRAGLKWSMINAHGWFSYLLKLKKNAENEIVFTLGSATDTLSAEITIGDEKHVLNEPIRGKKDFAFFVKDAGAGNVRVRIDRTDANTPLVFTIKVK